MSKKSSFEDAVERQLKAEGRIDMAEDFADSLSDAGHANTGTSILLSAAGLICNLAGYKETGKLLGKTSSRLRERRDKK